MHTSVVVCERYSLSVPHRMAFNRCIYCPVFIKTHLYCLLIMLIYSEDKNWFSSTNLARPAHTDPSLYWNFFSLANRLFFRKAIFRTFLQYCLVFGSSSSNFFGGPVWIFHNQSGYSLSGFNCDCILSNHFHSSVWYMVDCHIWVLSWLTLMSSPST